MNIMEHKEIKEWLDNLYNIHYPRWEELPDFDIYMDQVLGLLERYLGFLQLEKERIITPNMINNYVKLKLIPKPHQKKYNKTHLAYLIAIMSLKQVLTISEIKDGILYQTNIVGLKKAYNGFCEMQELAIKENISLISDDYKPIVNNKVIDQSSVVVILGTRAFASKIIASHIVTTRRINKQD